MATSKKASKSASTKKSAAKKSSKAAKSSISFALTPERIAAIQRCLQKGTLRVTVSRADLLKGRVKDPWLYD